MPSAKIDGAGIGKDFEPAPQKSEARIDNGFLLPATFCILHSTFCIRLIPVMFRFVRALAFKAEIGCLLAG